VRIVPSTRASRLLPGERRGDWDLRIVVEAIGGRVAHIGIRIGAEAVGEWLLEFARPATM
jgi:hypothetical protein